MEFTIEVVNIVSDKIRKQFALGTVYYELKHDLWGSRALFKISYLKKGFFILELFWIRIIHKKDIKW